MTFSGQPPLQCCGPARMSSDAGPDRGAPPQAEPLATWTRRGRNDPTGTSMELLAPIAPQALERQRLIRRRQPRRPITG
jgi:hypothetical protein